MNIPLSSPDITQSERRYVQQVLETPYLSLGPMLPRFESSFSRYVGTTEAVAVNSGTSGLHLVIKALDIGQGDVVLTTPFSFIASANCILYEGAQPAFVDIDPDTYNIDPEKLEDRTAQLARSAVTRPRAILPVHVFGHPCEMDHIVRTASRYGLTIVEDSCEAIGAEHNNRKVGTFGRAGVFAFYPNKQMTTGEGGIIVTDDEQLASLCRSLRNQGRSENGGWLSHERLGYNYRLSDINCALGLAQLERIEEILVKRALVASLYRERLEGLQQVRIPQPPKSGKTSWFVYVVELQPGYTREQRDAILAGLRSAGIGCNAYFTPIHLQPFYRRLFGYREGDFPVTEDVASRTIALPFYNNLTEAQVDYVVDRLAALV